jgi:hypothetical protein
MLVLVPVPVPVPWITSCRAISVTRLKFVQKSFDDIQLSFTYLEGFLESREFHVLNGDLFDGTGNNMVAEWPTAQKIGENSR